MLRVFLLAAFAAVCFGHALPTPIVQGPLRVRGNLIIDANGFNVELNGVNVPETVAGRPAADVLFKVIRRRWNLNAVRLPVSVARWSQQGEAYMRSVEQAVSSANAAGLAVVLVAREDAALPSPAIVPFWQAWAERFESNGRVIFDAFDKPSPASLPGRSWDLWLNGGTGFVGMRQIVEAIRSTGARQVVAVQAFSDANGFEGFQPAHWLPDPNVIYEVHPYFDRALTAADRQRTFGFLTGSLHIYAGEWGLPLQQDTQSCRSVPPSIAGAGALVADTLRFFAERRMSWTASSFEPGSLIANEDTYVNTKLERVWTCGDKSDPTQGMGELLLLTTTGDPTGFGELLREFVVNAATGFVAPIAPGEVLSVYGAEIGPYPGIDGRLDENGRLPSSVGAVQVFFDGVPAPLFFASAYQVNIIVPYAVAGKPATEMQLFYDGVPSSKLRVEVGDASPGIFADFSRQAKALNQDASINSPAEPAAAGSVVVLFATGAGTMSPPRPEGAIAVAPFGAPVLPVSVRIGSLPAEVLYAGEAPGLVGTLQVNARVPDGLTSPRAITRQVELSVGSRTSTPVTIWVR
jgi:uncharacterized protein (TIGR03437 family)